MKSIETSWRLQVITKSNYTEEYGLTLKAKNQVNVHNEYQQKIEIILHDGLFAIESATHDFYDNLEYKY